MLRQIEGNGRTFSYLEVSNSVVSEFSNSVDGGGWVLRLLKHDYPGIFTRYMGGYILYIYLSMIKQKKYILLYF